MGRANNEHSQRLRNERQRKIRSTLTQVRPPLPHLDTATKQQLQAQPAPQSLLSARVESTLT